MNACAGRPLNLKVPSTIATVQLFLLSKVELNNLSPERCNIIVGNTEAQQLHFPVFHIVATITEQITWCGFIYSFTMQ